MIQSHLRRRDTRKARKGMAAAELGLLLPLLSFILAATVDFARIFYFYLTVSNCACNGALYASNPKFQSQSPYTSVQAAAVADASNLSAAPTIATNYSSSAAGPYNSSTVIANGYVQVTATWTFNTILKYPGISSTVTLTRSVEMQMIPAY